jgi:hypothetical protein
VTKKYIARAGQKVTIEINRGQVLSPKLKLKRPKGLLDFRRDDDYQARRLKKKFTYRLIDLGRLASGADIPFSFAPAVTLDAKKYPTATAAFTAAQWTALQAYVLAQEPGELINDFREITETEVEKYEVQIRDKTGTLRTLAPDETYNFSSYGFEYRDGVLKFDGSIEIYNIRSTLCASVFPEELIGDELKITAAADPEADAAPFNYKKTTDWFLMPRIVFEIGRVFVKYFKEIDSVSYAHYRTGVLNMIYKPLPRALYLLPGFTGIGSQTLSDDELFNTIKANIAGTPGARFLINTTRAQTGTTATLLVGNSTAGAGTFPDLAPDDSPYEYAAPGIKFAPGGSGLVSFPISLPPAPPLDAAHQNYVTTEMEMPAERTLVAIARQGTNFYYFWNEPETAIGMLTGSRTQIVFGNTPG